MNKQLTSLHSITPHLAHERARMIDFLRSKGIVDDILLQVMTDLPRDKFIGDHFSTRAYEDSALPIGSGQTISQPLTVALMTQALSLQHNEKVLEIGTGSGYQAAVLKELGCKVYTIERHHELLTEARKRFDLFGFNDIISRAGDGSRGWDEYAPFDAIIVTAGAPDVPKTLIKQLKSDGGRLIIPIGKKDAQQIYLITSHEGKLSVKELSKVVFVPLIGKEGWAEN